MPSSESAPPPPLPDSLLSLAPLRLRNYRRVRYVADDLHVELAQLAPRDQQLLRNLYGRLTELLYTMADTSTTDAQKWEAIHGWTERHNLDDTIDEVREIGHATHEQDPGERLAKAMHDVRGGALSSLLGRLQLLDHLSTTPAALNRLFVLTRDHLKIMRNAMVGLDEPRRKADREPKAHAMALMLDKWQQSVVGAQWHERPIQMHIDCRYQGALTECCLESAAIDRIFYNLAANACRYTASNRLEMVVFPMPEPPGENLRFVLSNEVSPADAEHLLSMVQTGAPVGRLAGPLDLAGLFEPEVSSGGSGFGLTVVADFVAGAFGLRERSVALRERYVGAVLDGQTFRVWFHWPMAHAGLPQKLDDYHWPRQSLSEP